MREMQSPYTMNTSPSKSVCLLSTNKATHLTSASIHGPQVLGKLFSDIKIHVEVLEGGEGADLHGA